jgi:hypothetical protein
MHRNLWVSCLLGLAACTADHSAADAVVTDAAAITDDSDKGPTAPGTDPMKPGTALPDDDDAGKPGKPGTAKPGDDKPGDDKPGGDKPGTKPPPPDGMPKDKPKDHDGGPPPPSHDGGPPPPKGDKPMKKPMPPHDMDRDAEPRPDPMDGKP